MTTFIRDGTLLSPGDVWVADKAAGGVVSKIAGDLSAKILTPAVPLAGTVTREVAASITVTVVVEATATARGVASAQAVGEAVLAAEPGA